MDEIDNYLKHGIAIQIFESEKNLLIWESIAEQVPNFQSQSEHTKRLFSYIQLSAQTNFVLSTAKIFDTPYKNYPTRCILSFLELINKHNDFPVIESVGSTKTLLKHYGRPQSLIDSLSNKNSGTFAKEFYKYYLNEYNSDRIQTLINKVKLLRDKYVAHNEDMKSESRLEFETVRELLTFATEIVSIFGMAYYNSIWTINGSSRIAEDAKRATCFMTDAFNKLLKY